MSGSEEVHPFLTKEQYKAILERSYSSFTTSHKYAPKADIYYRVFGQGKEKLVFIMGLATRGDAWECQIEYFQQFPQFQCLVFDNRGTGQSTSTPGRYTTQIFASDVNDLLTHLNWDKVHLIGVSMGGMIAQELALLNSKAIQSLTLIASHAGGFRAFVPLRGMRLMLQEMAASDPIKKMSFTMQTLYSGTTLQNKTRYDELFKGGLDRLKRLGSHGSFRSFIQHYTATFTHYLSSTRLASLKAQKIPSLVLCGTHDYLVSTRNSKYLAEQLGARFVQFSDAGHCLQREYPYELNAEIFHHVSAHGENRECKAVQWV